MNRIGWSFAAISGLVLALGVALTAAAAFWWEELLDPAPSWALSDLRRTLLVVVPLLAVMSLGLAVINHIQQENPVQVALTRFLYAKTIFWVAFEISFYARNSVLWVLAEYATLACVGVTIIDLGVRLVRRYLGRTQGDSPALI